jgi:hypothetical protein
MESPGGQNKQKTLAKTKRYQAVVALDKCTVSVCQCKCADVKRMYMKWHVTQRLCRKLNCGGSLRHGKN